MDLKQSILDILGNRQMTAREIAAELSSSVGRTISKSAVNVAMYKDKDFVNDGAPVPKWSVAKSAKIIFGTNLGVFLLNEDISEECLAALLANVSEVTYTVPNEKLISTASKLNIECKKTDT